MFIKTLLVLILNIVNSQSLQEFECPKNIGQIKDKYCLEGESCIYCDIKIYECKNYICLNEPKTCNNGKIPYRKEGSCCIQCNCPILDCEFGVIKNFNNCDTCIPTISEIIEIVYNENFISSPTSILYIDGNIEKKKDDQLYMEDCIVYYINKIKSYFEEVIKPKSVTLYYKVKEFLIMVFYKLLDYTETAIIPKSVEFFKYSKNYTEYKLLPKLNSTFYSFLNVTRKVTNDLLF